MSYLFLLLSVFLEVRGDFNGDGKQEALTAQWLHGGTLEPLVPDTLLMSDYDSAIEIVRPWRPICRLSPSDPSLPPLDAGGHWPNFGVLYMKNEGDLDGNGTDEVGMLIDWADYSQMNTYRVYTLKGKQWKEVLAFEVREFDVEPPFEGFLFRDAKGRLLARTYNKEAFSVEKRVRVKK